MFNKIICVTDRKICTVPFLEQIEKVCMLKPQALILREKDLSETEYQEMAKQVLAICRQHGTVFVVHTFWRAALELGVNNVHVPLALLKDMTAAERKSSAASVLLYTVWKKRGRQRLWAQAALLSGIFIAAVVNRGWLRGG